MLCTGADAERLECRLANVLQTRINGDQLTWGMQWGMKVEGASGIEGIRYRDWELGCGEALESEKCREVDAVPHLPVEAGTYPVPAERSLNRSSCYK